MLELSAENLDQAALLDLLRERDPLGVLSIYVDADRGGRQAGVAAIDIKNRLAGLERRLESDRVPDRGNALRRILRVHWPDIERLVDPREQGQGRALYLPLSGGEPSRFSSRLPLPNRVVLDDSAFIHPLLELIDEGQRSGVVVLSGREVNVLEWRVGELRCIDRLAAEEIEAPHERSGPVGTSPSSAVASPMREQRQARLRNQQQTLLAEAATAISQLADERAWERVLISGGERMREALVRALPQRVFSGVVRETRTLTNLTRPELEATVTQRLLADNRDRELRLVQAMRESALGRGEAALGLSEVLAALNDGRAAHVAYDPGVRYTGSIDELGALHPEGETPPAPGSLDHEPRLTERIVERSLATGARITPVEGASADALAEAGGIAALLRW